MELEAAVADAVSLGSGGEQNRESRLLRAGRKIEKGEQCVIVIGLLAGARGVRGEGVSVRVAVRSSSEAAHVQGVKVFDAMRARGWCRSDFLIRVVRCPLRRRAVSSS